MMRADFSQRRVPLLAKAARSGAPCGLVVGVAILRLQNGFATRSKFLAQDDMIIAGVFGYGKSSNTDR